MWGDVLCRGSGGRSPPEAEAILDFYMHNFDRILNYFCFSRATEIRLTLWIREKYRENVKIWGDIIHWRPPHSKFWGDVSPRPPRFTPLPSVTGTSHAAAAAADAYVKVCFVCFTATTFNLGQGVYVLCSALLVSDWGKTISSLCEICMLTRGDKIDSVSHFETFVKWLPIVSKLFTYFHVLSSVNIIISGTGITHARFRRLVNG